MAKTNVGIDIEEGPIRGSSSDYDVSLPGASGNQQLSGELPSPQPQPPSQPVARPNQLEQPPAQTQPAAERPQEPAKRPERREEERPDSEPASGLSSSPVEPQRQEDANDKVSVKVSRPQAVSTDGQQDGQDRQEQTQDANSIGLLGYEDRSEAMPEDNDTARNEEPVVKESFTAEPSIRQTVATDSMKSETKTTQQVRMQMDQYIKTDPMPKIKYEPKQDMRPLSTYNRPAEAVKEAKASERKAARAQGLGNGVAGQMVSDPNIRLTDASFGTHEYRMALQHEQSPLRDIVAKYDPQADIELMIQNDEYCYQVLDGIFSANDIPFLCIKHPTPSTADQHVRFAKVHNGDSAKLHPLSLKVFNADADGDMLYMSLNQNAAMGVNYAMDFLIGSDNQIKIDDAIFDIKKWWSDGSDDPVSTVRELLQEHIPAFSRYDGRSLRPIAEGIVDTVNGVADGFKKILRAIRNLAINNTANRIEADFATDEMIRGLWDYNRLYWDATVFNTLYETSDYEYSEDRFEGLDQYDKPANAPSNFFDYQYMMRQPIGFIPGKNPQFRFLAAASKPINAIKGIVWGKSTWKNEERNQWKNDVDEIIARQISGLSGLREQQYYPVVWVRTKIMKEVQSPRAYSSIGSFLNVFAASYRKYHYISSMANVVIRNEYSKITSNRKSWKYSPLSSTPDIEELANVFKQIYGDIDMGLLFKEPPVGSKHMTLNQYIESSRLQIFNNSDANSTKMTEKNFISALANIRTKKVNKVDKDFDESCQKFFEDGVSLFKKAYAENNQSEYYSRASEAMYNAYFAMGQGAFDNLGMDTLGHMIKNDLGNAIVNAKNSDQLGGLFFEVYARNKLLDLYRLQKAGRKQEFAEELDRISRSSDTWRAIAIDIRNKNSLFKTIKKADLKNGKLIPGDNTLLTKNAAIWERVFEYDNIVDGVLFNRDLTASEKKALLNDFQKASPMGNRFQQPWAVTMEIMSEPEQISPGIGMQADFDRSSAFDWFNAASRYIDAGVREFNDNMIKEVNEAYNSFNSENRLDAVVSYIDRIANGSVQTVELGLDDYTDAVVALFDPTYSSSEKSKQETAVNNLYSSLSLAISGKLYSDLELADDAALGKMAYDRFISSPRIIAMVLTGKIKELEIYDGTGSEKVSREKWLGKDPNAQDVWDFLINNPRIAMSLRMTKPMISAADKDAGTSLVASHKLDESISLGSSESYSNVFNTVLMKMANHPIFGGFVALSLPVSGMKKSQMHSYARKATRNLIENIIELSYSNGTPESIAASIVEKYDEQLVALDSSLNWTHSDEKAGELIRNYMQKNIASYIKEVREMNLDYVPTNAKPIDFNIRDIKSVEMFFHVAGALSGAQTSISTAVNGGESRRNALLALVSSNIEDDCDSAAEISISVDEFNRSWNNYIRYKVAGTEEYVTESNATDLILRAINDGSETIVLENPASCTAESPCVCKRHMTMDPSTVNTGKVVTPVSRFMLTKRADGTEALNLKRKKEGDDGKDRIIKTSSIDMFELFESKRITDVISSDPGITMDEARTLLARYMKEVNESLEYKDMTEADYINIAQFMIRRNPESGELYVASLEELAMLVTDRIYKASKSASRPLTFNDVMNIGKSAINEYYGLNTLYDSSAISKQAHVTPLNLDEGLRVENQRMSSAARNVELINALMNKLIMESRDPRFPKRNIATSVKDVELQSNKIKKKTNVEAVKQFNFVGLFDKNNDIMFAPGPQNAWLIDSGASAKSADAAIKNGKRYCMNVIFKADNEIAVKALNDSGEASQIVPLDGGFVMIPFFDMRLNGRNTSGNGGAFNIGVTQVDESNVVRMVEDKYNSFGLTDSEIQLTSSADRIQVNLSGTENVSYVDLFPNIIKGYGPSDLVLNLPTKNEISDLLFSKEYHDDGFFETWFDPGYIVGKNFKFSDTDKMRFSKYRALMEDGMVDENGWVTNTEVEPGDIIGFARVYFSRGNTTYQKWAAVKAFDLNRSNSSAPQKIVYTSTKFYNQFNTVSSGTLRLDWQHTGSVLGHTTKIFEGPFAADKFITRPTLPEYSPERKLQNGWDVDGYVASFSTASRRAGYLKNQLMATLMAEARLTKNGYNFAELPGVFPNNENFKEALRTGNTSFDMWEQYLPTLEFFPVDYPDRARMNAFCRQLANKALNAGVNPAHVFASHFEGVPSKTWFRFEAVFNGSSQFQDNLMEFFHFIDPTLCPKNQSDPDISRTLFNNQLQMLVPFNYPDGEIFYDWANVFTGLHFMDAHYSGSHAFGRTAVANRSLSIDVTTMYGGRYLVPGELQDIINHASRSYSKATSSFMMVNEDNPEADVDAEV